MLLQLIAFELRFFSKQLTFRLTVVVFFIFGLLFAVAPFGGGANYNAPLSIALRLGLLSLNALFAITLFAAQSILRDRECGMESLIFSTPITHFQYLVSRFVGLCSSSILAFTPALVGIILGHVFLTEAHAMGPTMPVAYLWSFGLLVIPNLVLCCAALFCTATLARNSLATYVVGVALFIAYWVTSTLGNSPLMAQSSPYAPSKSNLMVLLEPFGIVGILDAVRFWTVEQQNQWLIPMQGPLLMNRLLWLGMACSLFALTFRLFRFRELSPASKTPVERETWVDVAYHSVARQTLGVRRDLRQVFAQVRLGCRTLFRSAPFYLFVLLWIFFCLATVFDEQRSGFLSHRVHVDTALVLNVLHEPLIKLGALMVLFFSAELFWLERQSGIHELIYSSGLRPWSHFIAKLLVLFGLVLVLVSGTGLLGLAFQLAVGSAPIAFTAVAQFVVSAWVPLALVAWLSLILHNLTPNKYSGLIVIFFVVILFSGVILTRFFGLDHPFWRLIWAPTFNYSTFAGTSYVGWSFLWPATYSAGILTCLLVPALLFWQNGAFPNARRSRLWLILIGGMLVALTAGLTTASQIDLRQRTYSRKARLDWLSNHERTYAQRAHEPTPRIDTFTLDLEILPNDRAFAADGQFGLVNPHTQALAQCLIRVPNSISIQSIELNRGVIEQVDDGFGYYAIHWSPALQPGERDLMNFTIEAHFDGLRPHNPELYVTPGASYLEMDKAIPQFGYQASMVINDQRERLKRGLSELPEPVDCADLADVIEDRVQFKARITTTSSQQVVAPGSLLSKQQQGPLTTYSYASQAPISLGIGIASGDYQERFGHHGNLPIRILTASDHQANLDSALQGAMDALSYFEANFGPYPHQQLVIAEIPSFSDSFAATAYPGLIYMVEDRTLSLDQRRGPATMVHRLMAHELSHQWWAHQVDPAECDGARMLTETLAEYSQMVVTEKRFGSAATLDYQKAMDSFYFTWRSYDDEPEPALSRVGSQAYVAYFKGSHAMYVLRHLLGEAKVNEILQHLCLEYSYPTRPTAADLLALIQPHLDPEQKVLVTRLFEMVSWYDLRIEQANAQPLDRGWLIQVTLYVAPRGDDADRKETYLLRLLGDDQEILRDRSLTLTPGKHELEFTVDQCPTRVSLDPELLKLEADRSDNAVKVTVVDQHTR